MGLRSALGLGGRSSAGKKASARLNQIAGDLRRFRPIRTRSAIGEFNLSGGGAEFTPTEQIRAALGDLEGFFGGSAQQLREFDEGGATERTLGLLRQRRQQKDTRDLSRLRSGLFSSGRIGLETGADTTNPELKAFFAAQQGADLEAQLVASEEARRERAGLLQSTLTAGQGLFQLGTGGPLADQAFNLANLGLARDTAAANISAQGVGLQFQADQADFNARAGLFSGIAGSLFDSIDFGGLFGSATSGLSGIMGGGDVDPDTLASP